MSLFALIYTPVRRSRVLVSAVYSAHCTVQLTLTWARPPPPLRSLTNEHITRLTNRYSISFSGCTVLISFHDKLAIIDFILYHGTC